MLTISALETPLQRQRSTRAGLDCEARPGESPNSGIQFEARPLFAALEHGSMGVESALARVVLQDHCEPPKDFARRVVRALRGLGQPQTPAFATVLLAFAPGVRADQLEARCSLCTALLRHFADSELELVLVCNRGASRDEQAHARALAQSLRDGRHARCVVHSL